MNDSSARMLICFLLLCLPMRAICGADDRKIPRDGKETSLVRIKADPSKFSGKSIVICGGIEVSDYYNYFYEHRQRTMYSIRFLEAGEKMSDSLGQNVHLYLEKENGEPIMEELLKAAEENEDRKLPLVRIKASLNGASYSVSRQWDMLEVQDVQFYDAESGDWLPWILKTAAEVEASQLAVRKAEMEKAKGVRDKERAAKKAVDDEAADKKAKADKIERDKKAADGKIRAAEQLLKAGKKDAYRKMLQEVVDKYPDTPAAEKARKALK